MRVPDLRGVANAISKSTSAGSRATPFSDLPISSANSKRRRAFDLANAFLVASGSPGRTTVEERDVSEGLTERQTCASGLVYYACGNGFKGCCATNACNGNTGCPASSHTTALKAVTTNIGTPESISFATVTTVGLDSATTARSTSSRSTTSTRSTFATTSASTSSATSTSSSTTSSASPTSTAEAQASTGNSNSVGAIAGGVVGGVVGLIIILALIAFSTRRHRRIVEERRANRERDEMTKRSAPNFTVIRPHSTTTTTAQHDRSHSTANDIQTPQSGPTPHPPSAATFASNTNADFSELEGHSSAEPGLRAERGRGAIPAAVLRPPQMLDGTEVKRPGSHASTSRSSIFREHIQEMEDTARPPTSSPTFLESPILGRPTTSDSLVDETRRKQHLMSWNNYDPTQATDGREEGRLSATMAPKTPPSARASPVVKGQVPKTPPLELLQPTKYEGRSSSPKAPKRGWSLRGRRG